MLGMTELLSGMSRVNVRWMLGGSVAAMCYSEPRATLDVDCILDLHPGQEIKMVEAFPEADFYLPPLNVIAHEIRRGALGSFNIIHHNTGFKADCYPCGTDALMLWGLTKAEPLSIADLIVPVAPPEYIIAMKLRYFAISGQDKHLRDIRSMMAITTQIDRELIDEWARRFGVGDAWRLAQSN